MEWIRCSERMPDTRDDIHGSKCLLIYNSENRCQFLAVWNGIALEWQDWTDVTYRHRENEITHWSELPDPPKEQA